MNRRGFYLIEVLMGICLIGLIAVTALPIVTFSYSNFNRVKIRSEMCFIGELAIEKLKSNNSNVVDYINQLEYEDSIEYTDESFDKKKYICTIYKVANHPRVMDIKIKVHRKEKESSSYVEYIVSIPKK